MGKLYYILVIALLTMACERDDAFTNGKNGELTFFASITGMANTRASQAVDFASHGLDIAGYHTEGKIADAIAWDEAAVYPNIFDYDKKDSQIPVPHITKNADGKFVLNTVKWKLDQTSYLSYFAWSQGATKSTSSGIVDATKDDTTPGYPWIDVVNVDDPTKQVDVAAARHLNEKNHRVISAVDLEFKHVLSKLTFRFKSSAGANVSISKMNLSYAANQIRSKGRYTFNGNPADSIGHFGDLTGYHSGTFSLGTGHALTGGDDVTVGEMMLIPQSVSKGFLKFDLTYTIASSEGIYTHNKSVDMPASELFAGSNHIYTVDIYAEQIIVHQAMVSGWIPDATPRLPFVFGPMGDTQLMLDGYDKPYQHVDGKWYWLDRSGYNRHMEITGNNIATVYNDAEHCYNFDGSTVINAPYSIGTVTALSLDIVLETKVQNNCVLFDFSSTKTSSRPFFCHYGYVGGSYTSPYVVFDAGGTSVGSGRLDYNISADILKRNFVSWQREDAGKQQLYLNAGLVMEQAAVSSQFGAVGIRSIGNTFNGKIFYIKLTSKMNPIKDIVKSFQNCATKYNIPNNSNWLPPVKNGLIFCFDGRSKIKTVDGKNYWVDEVGKNDVLIIGNVTYNSTGFYFEVPANTKGSTTRKDYMKMLFPVAMPNDFTAEFVLKPNSRGSESPMFWGIDDQVGTIGRYLYMHLPYSNGSIFVDSPGLNRYSFNWPANVGGELIPRRVVIRRKYGVKSEFFMYNKVVGSGAATVDISSVECAVLNFGGYDWSGRFYAIRLYDRALTDAEITQNHVSDKAIFKFTEN